jgi:hypothetical protein
MVLYTGQAAESPAESRYAASEASTTSLAEEAAADEDVHSRAASHSQASSSSHRGPGIHLSSISLGGYFKPPIRPSAAGFSPMGAAATAAAHQQQQQQAPPQPQPRKQGGMKGPSHRRAGSWATMAFDVPLPSLVDTVRTSRALSSLILAVMSLLSSLSLLAPPPFPLMRLLPALQSCAAQCSCFLLELHWNVFP